MLNELDELDELDELEELTKELGDVVQNPNIRVVVRYTERFEFLIPRLPNESTNVFGNRVARCR